MKLKVAGINFDHFHMGDLLRMAHEHPDVEITGICDEQPERMADAARNFGLTNEQVFTDIDACITGTRPDFVILCPATARHAQYVELVARHRVHILLEKPFASSVEEADRMIAAADNAGVLLAINWPMRWVASHVTAHRLLNEGAIGTLREIHYYGGNRGPLYHGADKLEVEPTDEMKRNSWFYKESEGGGSLLDYLGYGTTLGTWYHNGAKPLDVTAVTDLPNGLEVDEHSITIARYESGLSKLETRWGTFTDPWVHNPSPMCGFVLKGEHGTISSPDYSPEIRVQSREHPEGVTVPSDTLEAPYQNPIQYFAHCITTGTPLEGPLAPDVARIGQQIVDSAVLSATQKQTVPLVP